MPGQRHDGRQVVDVPDDGFVLEPADMAAACFTISKASSAKSSGKHGIVSASFEKADRASERSGACLNVKAVAGASSISAI